MKKTTNGFTIVELLIVIVVIAILAAISIVAYTGMQQRAANTAIIAAANQSVKAISAYIAANGTYPFTGATCVVSAESSCTIGNTTDREIDATFASNIQTISTLPTPPLPDTQSTRNGIGYVYDTSRTFNGINQPVVLSYSLRGNQQQCGVANVAEGGSGTFISSTTGWTSSSGGFTVCYIIVPGPES